MYIYLCFVRKLFNCQHIEEWLKSVAGSTQTAAADAPAHGAIARKPAAPSPRTIATGVPAPRIPETEGVLVTSINRKNSSYLNILNRRKH